MVATFKNYQELVDRALMIEGKQQQIDNRKRKYGQGKYNSGAQQRPHFTPNSGGHMHHNHGGNTHNGGSSHNHSGVGKRSNFKKILRTRKIMVMHSNERGEYCLRTLVDRKRKHYENTVDVVVRLHGRPILVPKVRHLRGLHMFGSVTSHELTIQQSVEGELRQHDGVMMVMMMLPLQGFA